MARRNVLFIIADQWRGDALGALGATPARTPNIDALCADAATFVSHYAQATPCGPSRATLMTGLYLMNHRVGRNGTPLDKRHANLAMEARRAGYGPILFGYSDITPDPRGLAPRDPRLAGYQGVLPGLSVGQFERESQREWIAWLRERGFPGPHDKQAAHTPAAAPDAYPGKGVTFAPARYGAAESDVAWLVDRAISWLDSNHERPWFLHLALLRPHPPWIAPAPFHALIDAASTPPPRRAASAEAEAKQHPLARWLIENTRFGRFAPHGDPNALVCDLSDQDLAQVRATYYGLVAEVDAQVGRMLDALRRIGQFDDTLIVLTSDHGEMLGDHYMMGKSGYFDAAYHVPLVIRDPRPAAAAARGRRHDAFTEAVDLMPTMLDWIGLEAPAACDGRSLRPFLEGDAPANWRQAVYWEHDFRDVRGLAFERAHGLNPDQCVLAARRTRTEKYVHFPDLPPLFFDLGDDPHELRDRAGDPAYAERMLEAAQGMLSWRLLHADRTLANMHAGDGGVHEWRGPRAA